MSIAHDSSPEDLDFSDREMWIPRLLYAPAGGAQKSVEGRTRLVKGLFLIEQMFDEKIESFTGTGFEFYPYKYGPFDESVYDTLEQLIRRGLVKEESTSKYNGDMISLTDDGEIAARTLFEELTDEEQKLLTWIKGKHVQQPVAQLLSFVYNRYPSFAENSEASL
jgi:uncharacterized protein YwgA